MSEEKSIRQIQADLWMTVPGWKELLDKWNSRKSDEERWAEGIVELKRMAIAGEPRPKEKTPLGRLLYHITTTKSAAQGGGPFPVALIFPNAHTELMELAPKWFRKKIGQKKRTFNNMSAEEKVAALWEIAKKQKAEAAAIVEGKYQYTRPQRTEELGNALTNYTNKKNKAYRSDFDEAIRKFIPEWFHQSRKENRRTLWEAQKKELLDMVRRGEKQPFVKKKNRKIKENQDRKERDLAFALRDFTRKAFQKRNGVLQQNPKYDPDFTKEIMEENRIYQAGWTFGSDEPNIEFTPKRKYATAG